MLSFDKTDFVIFEDFPGNITNFQKAPTLKREMLLSSNFVVMLRMTMKYFGIKMSKIGRFFKISKLGLKIGKSVFSLGRRSKKFFLPKINSTHPWAKYPVKLGLGTLQVCLLEPQFRRVSKIFTTTFTKMTPFSFSYDKRSIFEPHANETCHYSYFESNYSEFSNDLMFE